MTKPRPVSAEDYEALKVILAELPRATQTKVIAQKWGRNPVTTKIYIDLLRNGEPFLSKERGPTQKLRCKGIVREVFAKLDAMGYTGEALSRKVGCSRFALTRWRQGAPISLYMLECFAQVANMRITLEDTK